MRIASFPKTALAFLAVSFFLMNGSCESEGDMGQGLLVAIYGPPKSQDYEQAPFEGCSFMKICYKLAKSNTLQGCKVVPWPAGEAVIDSLPIDEAVCITAECLPSAPGNSSQPLDLPISSGQTCPIKHEKGESVETTTLYMLNSGSFGPTYQPPSPDGSQEGRVTFPYEQRWGAVMTELVDGIVLIAGGVDQVKSDCEDWTDPKCIEKASNAAELYDPANGSFTLVGTAGDTLMSQRRAFAASVELPSGQVAIFGGFTDHGKPTDTVDIYDRYTRTFSPGPPMSVPRGRHTATLISKAGEGFVLLVGGYGPGANSWEVWTISGGTQATGSLAQPRWNHTATRVDPTEAKGARDMVVIAGGEAIKGEKAEVRDSVEIFDIMAQSLDPSPIALCSNDGTKMAKKTMHGAALVPKRNFLYIAGGFEDAEHSRPTRDICVFHTSKETWEAEKGKFLMKLARGALTVTPLPGNLVLLAGGLTRTDKGILNAPSFVEVILEYVDSNGNTKVEVGPGEGFPITMIVPRWDHEALLTCDGRVLLIGGLKGSPTSFSVVESSELFNQFPLLTR